MGCCCGKQDEPVKNTEPLVKPSERVELNSLTTVNMDNVPKRSILQGRYIARLQDLYDGDTMTVVVALDPDKPNELVSLVVRVMGMDCPELKGITKEAGTAAKHEALRFLGAEGVVGLPARKQTRDWFSQHPILITLDFVPVKEKWGRYLAYVSNSKGEKLGDHLISKGLAKPYDGGKKDQEEWEG